MFKFLSFLLSYSPLHRQENKSITNGTPPFQSFKKTKIQILFLFLCIFGFQTLAFPLKVQQGAFGDLKIYFTRYPREADLIVFMTSILPLERNKEEVWCLEKNLPDLRIVVTNIKSAADIVVYLTTFQSQSGWKKDNKWKGKLYSFSHR